MKNIRMKSAVVAMLASVCGLTAASAQSANTGIYPPGPTGQGGTITSVSVVNTPTVYTINDGVKDVVFMSAYLTFVDGAKSASGGTYLVPGGQRLVIENFSASCSFTQAAQAIASFNIGGVLAAYLPLPAMYWPADGGASYRAAATSPVRAYSDGPWAKLSVERSVSTGTGGCFVAAEGYLAPIQ